MWVQPLSERRSVLQNDKDLTAAPYPDTLEQLQGQGCHNGNFVMVGSTYQRMFSPPEFSESTTRDGLVIHILGLEDAQGVICQVDVPGQPTCDIDWAQRL